MINLMCGDVTLGGSIRVASTFAGRFAGLMFRRKLPQGSGLLLMPCGSIHMCFMLIKLDIVYLDSAFRVLATEPGLHPWHLGRQVKGARMVLELPEGTIGRCGITAGMTLKVEPGIAAQRKTNDEKREIHEYEGTGSCCES